MFFSVVLCEYLCGSLRNKNLHRGNPESLQLSGAQRAIEIFVNNDLRLVQSYLSAMLSHQAQDEDLIFQIPRNGIY
jgi:hypothetical protein